MAEAANPRACLRHYLSCHDACNGEWVSTQWAGGCCLVRTHADGTGVVRPLRLDPVNLQGMRLEDLEGLLADVQSAVKRKAKAAGD
jgi:hypothetical protein